MKTPPAEFYVDPARLRAERERVFARSWQIVGHVDQLANPGDYFTTRLGNEPLLFTNDGGTIRGFFNVCRHRAGPIAYGCGKAQRLVCRYHGWTYDLGGQLLRTMEMEGAEEFDPTQIRLQSVNVHRFGPLLFAALDPATPPFDAMFPGVSERCTPLGLERMGYVASREFQVKSNWKVYVDNFLEGYHIPLVHPALNREIDYRQYVTELGPRHTLQHAPVREGSEHYKGKVGRWPGVLLLAVPEHHAEHLRRPAAGERRDPARRREHGSSFRLVRVRAAPGSADERALARAGALQRGSAGRRCADLRGRAVQPAFARVSQRAVLAQARKRRAPVPQPDAEFITT